MGTATRPTSGILNLLFSSFFFRHSEQDRLDKSCSIRCLLFNKTVCLRYWKKGREKLQPEGEKEGKNLYSQVKKIRSIQMSGQSLRVIKKEGSKIGQNQFPSDSLNRNPLQDFVHTPTACTPYSLPHQSDVFSQV